MARNVREEWEKEQAALREGRPTSTRQTVAESWMWGAIAFASVAAVVGFIGFGNTFTLFDSYSDFDAGAAFVGAIICAIPVAPWIGFFHVFSRREEAPQA